MDDNHDDILNEQCTNSLDYLNDRMQYQSNDMLTDLHIEETEICHTNILEKENHEKDKNYSCNICDKVYSQRRALKMHLDVAHFIPEAGSKEVNLDLPGKNKINITQMYQDEIKWHHAVSNKSDDEKSNHDKIGHKGTKSRGKKTHPCFVCNKLYSSSYYLKTHIDSVHSGQIDGNYDFFNRDKSSKLNAINVQTEDKPSGSEEHISTLPDPSKTHICVPCNMGFSSNSNLRRHIRRKHISRYKRNQNIDTEVNNEQNCTFSVSSNDILPIQKIKDTVPINNDTKDDYCTHRYGKNTSTLIPHPNKKPMCLDTLNDPIQYQSHNMLTDLNKEVTEICPTNILEKENYEKDKNDSCLFGDKVYNQHSTLKTHLDDAHFIPESGSKEVNLDLPGKNKIDITKIYQDEIKWHHAGNNKLDNEKPNHDKIGHKETKSKGNKTHPCFVCSKLYSSSYYLKTHIDNVHSGRIDGNYDNSNRAQSNKLNTINVQTEDKSSGSGEHISTLPDPSKTHICVLCNMGFSNNSNLRRHIRRKHISRYKRNQNIDTEVNNEQNCTFSVSSNDIFPIQKIKDTVPINNDTKDDYCTHRYGKKTSTLLPHKKPMCLDTLNDPIQYQSHNMLTDLNKDVTEICPTNILEKENYEKDKNYSYLFGDEVYNQHSTLKTHLDVAHFIPESGSKEVNLDLPGKNKIDITKIYQDDITWHHAGGNKSDNEKWNHDETGHQGTKSKGKKTHSCFVCSKLYSSSYYLKTHIDSVHAGRIVPINNNTKHKFYTSQYAKNISTLLPDPNKKRMCVSCNKGFSNKSNLSRHMRKKHNNINNQTVGTASGCEKKASTSFPDIKTLSCRVVDHDIESTVSSYDIFPILKNKDEVPINNKTKHKFCTSQYAKNTSTLLPDTSKKRMCVSCNKGFYNKSNLNRHIKKKHNNINSQTVGTASRCEKNPSTSFLDIKTLTCRVVDHDIENMSISVECGKRFNRLFCLKKHVKFMHSEFEKEKAVPRQEINDTDNCKHCGNWFCKPKSVAYRCTICEKIILSKKRLKHHTKRHESLDLFSCPDCGKTYKTTKDLNNHKRIHAERLFKCGVCGKQFVWKSQLKYHLAQHNGTSKPFTCVHCSKQFINRSSLHYHMNRHKGIKPFKCQHCTSSFFTSNGLKKHKLTHSWNKFQCNKCDKIVSCLKSHNMVHTNEKPFTCDHCGKKFKMKINLTHHIKQSHGAKNISCPKCEKYFTCSQYLNIHMKTHNGEKRYECIECSKTFLRRDYLVKHMTMHNPVKQFICDKCGKQFNRKDYLKSHVKIMHGD